LYTLIAVDDRPPVHRHGMVGQSPDEETAQFRMRRAGYECDL
jgi:hypothetical protein